MSVTVSALARRVRASNWIPAIALLALAACGGGEPDPSSPQVTSSGEPRATALAAASSSEAPASTDSSDAATAAAVAAAPTPLAYCKTAVFGSKTGCIQQGASATDVIPADGSSSGQAPAVAPCSPVSVGQSWVAATPTPSTKLGDGNFVCFQFLMTTQTTLPIQVTLPAGTTGLAELYFVNSNTTAFKQVGSESPASPISMTLTNQNSRIVLMVRTNAGAAGQPMGVGIGVPAPVPMPNNTYQNAAIVPMGQTASGIIGTPGVDEAYYFYPQRSGQTTQEAQFNFTPNQTVTYRSAQQTAANTYTLGSEMTIPASSSGQALTFSTPNPPNTDGTTTPYGVMVKVKGINTSGPRDEPFSLRVATRANTIAGQSLSNTESISRYFPGYSGQLQAATYITAAVSAIDTNGSFVPGERVDIAFQQNTADPYSVPTVNTYTSDLTGKVNVTFQLPPCTGATVSKPNYGPAGSPTDHYNGTAQTASVTFSLPNAAAPKKVALTYLRICSETYLGRY